jgi:flagellar FliJ protein
MRRFRFRLQRVLDIRVQIRDEARQELVRRNAERDQQASILKALEDEFNTLGLKEGGTYSAGELVAVGAYSERLTIAIRRQQEVLAAAMRVAQEALERYIETSREAKALEMLKDRRLHEHTAESLREEGKLLDEMGGQLKTQ